MIFNERIESKYRRNLRVSLSSFGLRSKKDFFLFQENLTLLPLTWLDSAPGLRWESCYRSGTRRTRSTGVERAAPCREPVGGGGGERWSSCTPGTPPYLHDACHSSPPAGAFLRCEPGQNDIWWRAWERPEKKRSMKEVKRGLSTAVHWAPCSTLQLTTQSPHQTIISPR